MDDQNDVALITHGDDTYCTFNIIAGAKNSTSSGWTTFEQVVDGWTSVFFILPYMKIKNIILDYSILLIFLKKQPPKLLPISDFEALLVLQLM